MPSHLALGDSYTIGEGVAAEGTWPRRLAAALADDGLPVALPDVVATTGWTADELLAALPDAPIQPPYNLVTVLIGVNDQYRGREVDEHLPHFNRLLSHATGYADGDPARVLVVSIPDWSVSPFGADDARGRPAIAESIDRYNAAQREVCVLRGIAWVDITALSRELDDDPAMFVADRLHPSSAQYGRWLQAIEPAARTIVSA